MNKSPRFPAHPSTLSKTDAFVHPETSTPTESKVRITLDLPESLYLRLKMAALEQRKPMSKLLRQWLQDLV